jgi:hypothetical protein
VNFWVSFEHSAGGLGFLFRSVGVELQFACTGQLSHQLHAIGF